VQSVPAAWGLLAGMGEPASREERRAGSGYGPACAPARGDYGRGQAAVVTSFQSVSPLATFSQSVPAVPVFRA